MKTIKLKVRGLAPIYRIDEGGQVYQEMPTDYIKPLEHTIRSGYRIYKLVGADGKSCPFPAHRLVLMAFKKVDMTKRRVRFLDGDPGNPALANLEISRELLNDGQASSTGSRVRMGGKRALRGDAAAGASRRTCFGALEAPENLESMNAVDIAGRWSCEDIVRMARSSPVKAALLRDALMFRHLLVASQGTQA